MTTLEKTKYIIENLGVKQQFICDHLGMNKTSFSEFLSQKRGMKEVNKKKLEALLQNYIIRDNFVGVYSSQQQIINQGGTKELC